MCHHHDSAALLLRFHRKCCPRRCENFALPRLCGNSNELQISMQLPRLPYGLSRKKLRLKPVQLVWCECPDASEQYTRGCHILDTVVFYDEQKKNKKQLTTKYQCLVIAASDKKTALRVKHHLGRVRTGMQVQALGFTPK